MDYPWDNIYVLNLEHLEDKFIKIQNNLIKNGITKNIERFIGIYGINECPFGKEIQKTENNHDKWIFIEKMNEELKSKKIIDKKVGNKYEYLRPGEIGHLLSFIKIMGNALDNNYETILLLEDDAVINDDFKKKFMKSYNNLPSDWDLVYLCTPK